MMCKQFVFVLFLVISFSAVGQYDPDYNSDDGDLSTLPFKDRLYTGGNFWASFGNITSIDISPILGYRVTDKYSAGVGLKYNYYRQNASPSFSTSLFGGSIFNRYSIFRNFIAHAEFEMINTEIFTSFSSSERVWVPLGLVGGGFSSNGFQAILLYDLIGNENNPFVGSFGNNSRLYFRVGFLINL